MLVPHIHIAVARRWVLPGVFLLGCASRDVPARFPETSAASLEAPAGHSPAVTEALAGDPPLPGVQEQGWTGLREQGQSQTETGAADPHAHHGGHHAH